MGTLAKNDVVLIDSDSDYDLELQQQSKKQKVTANEPTEIAPFSKPFMQDSEDSEDSDVNGSPNANAHSDDDSEPTGPKPGPPGSSSLSSSSHTSDLEEMLESEFLSTNEVETQKKAMSRTIYETRKFLKKQGIMAFLEEYLPPTATSSDIQILINKLGFVPKDIPPLAEGSNLLQLIKLLHLAIKRVRQLRSRIDTFYTVDHVLEQLTKSSKILVITGAGISTSLGIPDFRSSKGFYSRISNLGLSDPQEVFDLEIFRTDPSIFYSIAHMILPPDDIYAPLHSFIRLLQDKGKLLRNYTQNIDNLEANAGILPDKMIQCHGSFAYATCITCGYKVKGEEIYPTIRRKEIPYCLKCSRLRRRLLDSEDTFIEESYGVMKPDITFFGEALPSLFHDNINQDLSECDLIISIGTSLKVAPVAEIVDKVPENTPQILINRDAIHHCNFDVSLLGFCDDVVSYLCHQLGPSWDIPHASYQSLLGEDGDNLQLVETVEKGVYNVENKETKRQMAAAEPVVMPVPDLTVLEPSLQ